MPNLRQLEYLVAVADTLNFRRAAERTNTTQPTLSEQIKALELRLGIRLLERSKTRVVVTAAGREVVEIARRMLDDAAEIRNLASRRGKALSGLLRLGIPTTVGPCLMQAVSPEIAKHYSHLKLQLREAPAHDLQRLLEEGSLDAVITPLPMASVDVETTVLMREPLLVALPPSHRLLSSPTVRLTELEGETFLALGQGHQLHEAVLPHLEKAGIDISLDYAGTSLAMIGHMVVMGVGFTAIPGIAARNFLSSCDGIKLLPFAERNLNRLIGMAWRRASPEHRRYQELAGIITEALSKLTFDHPGKLSHVA